MMEARTWRRLTARAAVVGGLMVMAALVLAGCGVGSDASTTTAESGVTGNTGGSSTATAGSTTSPTTGTDSGGKQAPDFSGTSVDGEQVSLGGFAGKPLVLIFWASW